MQVRHRFARRVVTFAALVLALTFAGSGQAALSFAFAHTTARPGELVRAYQADPTGNPVRVSSRVRGVMVYLVRLSTVPADPLRRRPYAGAIRIGPLRSDRAGVWFRQLPPAARTRRPVHDCVCLRGLRWHLLR
jgi:hypothetical protein